MKAIAVRIKKVNPEIETTLPRYAKNGDAGMDIVATSMSENGLYIEYGTNLAIEIPRGYVGLIYPRSSLSNYHLVLSNHVGVIDSGYRGEIKFRFKKTKEAKWAHPNTHAVDSSQQYDFPKIYNVGDKIGQLIVMPYPLILLEEVSELEDTDRGADGFGSSGK